MRAMNVNAAFKLLVAEVMHGRGIEPKPKEHSRRKYANERPESERDHRSSRRPQLDAWQDKHAGLIKGVGGQQRYYLGRGRGDTRR